MGSEPKPTDTTTKARGRPPAGPAFTKDEAANLERLVGLRGWTTSQFYDKFCAANPREKMGLEHFRKLTTPNGSRLGLREATRAAFASTIPATLEAFNAFLKTGDFAILSPVGDSSGPQIIAQSGPSPLVLTTQKSMPQWADFREIDLKRGHLCRLGCTVVTESPYFRFGFKLLAPNSKIFGDASIKSNDSNLVVHIGRNNWDRPHRKISAEDMFSTYSINGVNPESDRPIPSAHKKSSAALEVEIEPGFLVKFAVNGDCYFRREMPPEICRRVVMLAWGDHEECTVEVRDLVVSTTPAM